MRQRRLPRHHYHLNRGKETAAWLAKVWTLANAALSSVLGDPTLYDSAIRIVEAIAKNDVHID